MVKSRVVGSQAGNIRKIFVELQCATCTVVRQGSFLANFSYVGKNLTNKTEI